MKHIERILIAIQALLLIVKIMPKPSVFENMGFVHDLPWVWVVSPLWVPMAISLIIFILQEFKRKQVR